ncbi:MAG: DUF2599 domain-containing protein [Brevibacterium sp.]
MSHLQSQRDTSSVTFPCISPESNNVDFTVESGKAHAEGTDASVELSTRGSKTVTLESELESLRVQLPIPKSVSPTVSDGQGALFADSDFPGATVLAKEDGSVQIATIIDSPDSATEFDYEIGSNSETTLRTEDDGSVSILDRDGEWIGGASAPWAEDANGKNIPAHYTIDGSTLTQHVSIDSQTEFPVVADPYLGMKLIKKTVWAKKNNKYSPTLKVYPTTWGRTASSIARGYAWEETRTKTKRKGWPNPNTKSMKNQFYCHYDFVRIRAPRKESWNLDTKLPNRGYWGFAKKGCN